MRRRQNTLQVPCLPNVICAALEYSICVCVLLLLPVLRSHLGRDITPYDDVVHGGWLQLASGGAVSTEVDLTQFACCTRGVGSECERVMTIDVRRRQPLRIERNDVGFNVEVLNAAISLAKVG